jgi:hypothetical protein
MLRRSAVISAGVRKMLCVREMKSREYVDWGQEKVKVGAEGTIHEAITHAPHSREVKGKN